MSVRLYIEGGGDGQLLDTLFRQAWRTFFEAVGLAGRKPHVVRGQRRNQTFDMFRTAVANARPGDLPILLVDSEDPVATGHSTWQHLRARDNWDKPAAAASDQAFLMVQVMETWFLADVPLLKSYFGASFRGNHIRKWPALEAVPKRTVMDALRKATAACDKKYSKGKVSFELLGMLKPASVEAKCPRARAFLDHLRSL